MQLKREHLLGQVYNFAAFFVTKYLVLFINRPLSLLNYKCNYDTTNKLAPLQQSRTLYNTVIDYFLVDIILDLRFFELPVWCYQ
jgi:hypothetical protein